MHSKLTTTLTWWEIRIVHLSLLRDEIAVSATTSIMLKMMLIAVNTTERPMQVCKRSSLLLKGK